MISISDQNDFLKPDCETKLVERLKIDNSSIRNSVKYQIYSA